MTDVYVVRNQLGQFWGKAKAWTDGREPRAIMRTSHEDEAINTLFELSSRDIELRGEVARVPLSERCEPVVEPSEHLIEPEARAKPETEQQVATETEQGAQASGPDPQAESLEDEPIASS